MAAEQCYNSLTSPLNFRENLKLKIIYPFSLVLVALFAFSAGYAVACEDSFSAKQILKQQNPQTSEPDLQNSVSFPAKLLESEEQRNITIIFTVDEAKRIHILQISGGYNLLTDYIRKSLEGKVLESENAVPGINYVMTVKFPSTV